MGNEGGKAEQMGPELRGKGCENFPILFFFFFPLQFAWECLETILEEQVLEYLGYSLL